MASLGDVQSISRSSPGRDDILRGYRRRTHEAEAVARDGMAHLLENKDLGRHFADDQVDALGARPEEERAAIWGTPPDLGEALAGFPPDHVPDE